MKITQKGYISRILFDRIFTQPFTKIFCIPESFNLDISHQLFDYTINLGNTQH